MISTLAYCPHSDIYILKSLVKYLIYEQKEQLVYSNGITTPTLRGQPPIDCFMMFSNAININEYNATSPHNIPILPYCHIYGNTSSTFHYIKM